MTNIGIVEGFFGPAWDLQARLDFAPFLKKYGGEFYIYAPKRDAKLRKAWRETWDQSYLTELKNLKEVFKNNGLKFGVALSPFGLGDKVTKEDQDLLKEKFKQLSALKIDYLGLFFDDMPSSDQLLKNQTEVVKMALSFFPSGLIFCPSYYSFDPILDKVFGKRPDGYVEGLISHIPSQVDICWTGPKVISEEISRSHLEEVKDLLGRKPFIWENLFANDGPKNCKYLKLKYFEGRDASILEETSGIAFNLMNQPYLSQILFLSSVLVLKENLTPAMAFEKSCFELLPHELADFLVQQRELFLSNGLDKLAPELKSQLLMELENRTEFVAQEIRDWLQGKYLVGPECLTD